MSKERHCLGLLQVLPFGEDVRAEHHVHLTVVRLKVRVAAHRLRAEPLQLLGAGVGARYPSR